MEALAIVPTLHWLPQPVFQNGRHYGKRLRLWKMAATMENGCHYGKRLPLAKASVGTIASASISSVQNKESNMGSHSGLS